MTFKKFLENGDNYTIACQNFDQVRMEDVSYPKLLIFKTYFTVIERIRLIGATGQFHPHVRKRQHN